MRFSILGLLACIAISFTACEKNTPLTPNVLDGSKTAAKLSTVVENQEDNAKKGPCFEFSGEVTYLLPDGSSVTGEQDVAKAEVKAWYEANPDSDERAILQFPVEIILEDETVNAINSLEELRAAKAACKNDRGGKGKGRAHGKKCFEFNGEVTYLLPDGSSVTEVYPMVKTSVKAWYEANPDSEERATLQFPVEITFEDETVSTINNQEELGAAKATCKG